MKRALALAAALALAGCASDGYYAGYASSYGYDGYQGYGGYGYDTYAPSYHDTWRPYGYTYDPTPYYYGAPALGGTFYWSDRDRRHDHDRRDGGRRDPDRDWDRDDVRRAPAERLEPGNALRPQAPRPAAPAERIGPTSGMTHEESIAAGGR